MNKSFWSAVIAYLLWGFVPLYWKQIDSAVSAPEILAHRIIWSLFFLIGLLLWQQKLGAFLASLRDWRKLWPSLLASILLTINWGVYIWAVLNNHIVEASLGYFINPLVTIALAMIFMGERLRRVQWIAIGFAAAGVIYLAVRHGQPPWIALTLAVSFGFYGLLKKKTKLKSAEGLLLETLFIFLPAVIFWFFLQQQGGSHFATGRLDTTLLLIGGGVVTALPLLFFAYGAQQTPLMILGLLQYIGPTIQLLIGIFLYHDSFNRDRQIGFSMIWLALILYSAENLQKKVTEDRIG